jgi:hypothetical protein
MANALVMDSNVRKTKPTHMSILELPAEILSKVVRNCIEQHGTKRLVFLMKRHTDDAQDFLQSSFDWQRSPEGWVYWEKYFDSIS